MIPRPYVNQCVVVVVSQTDYVRILHSYLYDTRVAPCLGPAAVISLCFKLLLAECLRSTILTQALTVRVPSYTFRWGWLLRGVLGKFWVGVVGWGIRWAFGIQRAGDVSCGGFRPEASGPSLRLYDVVCSPAESHWLMIETQQEQSQKTGKSTSWIEANSFKQCRVIIHTQTATDRLCACLCEAVIQERCSNCSVA